MVDKYNNTHISIGAFQRWELGIKPNNIQTEPRSQAQVYKPNIHDPQEMYRWQDEEANAHLLGCGQCVYWVHLDSLWVFICSLYSRSYFKG
jgi:hypothetical protein